MKMKNIYLTIAVLVVFAIALIFLLESKTTDTNLTTQDDSDVSLNNKVYRSEIGRIEFKHPDNVRVTEGQPVRTPVYIASLNYREDNLDQKLFEMWIATTTTTDVAQLRFNYENGLSYDNPAYDQIKVDLPGDYVISSSQEIVVGGKKALKRLLTGKGTNPSEMTWIHVINDGRLYSLSMGVPNNSSDPARDRAILERYLEVFLSSVKFL